MRNKVIIIAEAGVNHNGDMNSAKRLIDVACDAGVDFVKFQSFTADKLVSRVAKKAEYQIANMSGEEDTQYQMLKKLELSYEDHLTLIDYCNSKDISFFSTAFDIDGLDFLKNLGFEMYKIPSGEITNYPYLKKLAGFKKPVILSTGMSTIIEIGDALEVLTSEGLSLKEISVLHCNTEYPTPMIDVNLKAMNTIGFKYNVGIGYSDHTLGIEVPVAAVALGAKIIEKHFTLDRSLPGPDHKASLEPDELKEMVKAIRNIEKAISGNGKKQVSESEMKNLSIARKSLHYSKGLLEGEIINSASLVALRPGNGVSPMVINSLYGKKLNKNVLALTQISLNDFS